MPALFLELALLPDGWTRDVRVTIDGPRIARIERDARAESGDEHAAIGIPGVANLHCHAFQRGMAGLAERRGPATDSFWTWREEMYRFLRVLSPDDVEAIAAQAYAEMLEAGFTRVGEFHYLHHDIDGRAYTNVAEMAERIAAASAETGIGLSLLPSFYAHSGLGGAAPTAGQRRFITNVDGFANLYTASKRAISALPLATIGVAPHSLRAVTHDELGCVVALANADGMQIHIHAAEQVKEVEDCVAWSGKRPVDWLLDTQLIDHRWCLIHATHMTTDETRRLAQSGATAGLCPITEANLGDGIFSTNEHLDHGGHLGVGTDSNVRISLVEELRQLEYAQRLRLRLRNVVPRREGESNGRQLFELALAGGARALGLAQAGLAEGASADIVTLGVTHPALAHRGGDALLDGWIFASDGSPIESVWSLGRKVVADGRHIHSARIADRYCRVIAKVLAA